MKYITEVHLLVQHLVFCTEVIILNPSAVTGGTRYNHMHSIYCVLVVLFYPRTRLNLLTISFSSAHGFN